MRLHGCTAVTGVIIGARKAFGTKVCLVDNLTEEADSPLLIWVNICAGGGGGGDDRT